MHLGWVVGGGGGGWCGWVKCVISRQPLLPCLHNNILPQPITHPISSWSRELIKAVIFTTADDSSPRVSWENSWRIAKTIVKRKQHVGLGSPLSPHVSREYIRCSLIWHNWPMALSLRPYRYCRLKDSIQAALCGLVGFFLFFFLQDIICLGFIRIVIANAGKSFTGFVLNTTNRSTRQTQSLLEDLFSLSKRGIKKNTV